MTIDASKGNTQQITLKAKGNATTITNPTLGQELTIEWIQDAVGSRAYSWPSNCKFAGGSAPAASTEKAYTDSVTFRYDGTNWNHGMFLRKEEWARYEPLGVRKFPKMADDSARTG